MNAQSVSVAVGAVRLASLLGIPKNHKSDKITEAGKPRPFCVSFGLILICRHGKGLGSKPK